MSHRLIAHSPDLRALRDDGLHLEVRGGHLVVRDVPYVTASRQVRTDGVLISTLDTQVVDGVEVSARPVQHQVHWIGEHPCHADGSKIRSFEHPGTSQDLGQGLVTNHLFSAKADYRDYGHKIRAYLGWIAGEAQKLDPNATAETHPVYATDEHDDDPFHYIDTASSRVGIGGDNDKLQAERLGIIGLGGTGSYVLDLVVKTHVAEIRTFDGDGFDTHNAFRAPGAWSLQELQTKRSKVQTYADLYGKLRRRGLSVHQTKVTSANLELLEGLTFVFLCLDEGREKRAIIDWLIERNIPFTDVGMGVTRGPQGLQGIVRVVTGAPGHYADAEPHLSCGDADEAENIYATNIQIAELNALNAAMAVIRWKRLLGFYRDAGREHYSGYQIATGEMVVEAAEAA
jgi:molybdopterin/thiamine biosynthesis adenylyltransferase